MDEKNLIQESVQVARLMNDILSQHERENKRLWMAVITLALCVVVMAGCMVWAVLNVQNVANEAMLNALNTVAEMEVVTETTTQTVEGDSATINNGEWEQYNDNAAKNGGVE